MPAADDKIAQAVMHELTLRMPLGLDARHIQKRRFSRGFLIYPASYRHTASHHRSQDEVRSKP